jgi:hypothetical protein
MRIPSSSRPAAVARVPGPSELSSRLSAIARTARPSALSSRLSAAAGIAGPVAFTGAWVVASLRQSGHSAIAVQLSGLAAPNARDPGIMIAGFVALGACSIAFGGSLHRALGGSGRRAASPRPAGLAARAGGQRLRRVRPDPRQPGLGPRRAGLGPRLIECAGALTIAAGLLRRDHMMLDPPGAAASESWHNHAHDLVSSIVYVTLVVAPLLLAVRFRGDARWQRLWIPLLAGSAATAGLLGVFASSALGSWDPVLQRVAVTIPLAVLAAVAVRLMTVAPAGAISRTPALGSGYAPRSRASPQPGAIRKPDSTMSMLASMPWRAQHCSPATRTCREHIRPLHLMHGGGWAPFCPPATPEPSTDTRRPHRASG